MSRQGNIDGTDRRRATWGAPLVILLAWACVPRVAARQQMARRPQPEAKPSVFHGKTTRDYNRRLGQLLARSSVKRDSSAGDYRIGPEDLLKVTVFGAPDLGGIVRVSADGNISLPLPGKIQATGLTATQLQNVLEELLRRTYMKHPKVSVFVEQMESHPVSVFGAVQKPGVYQIRGPETLIEVLSHAHGLAADAGDTVIVMRHGGSPTAGVGLAAKNHVAGQDSSSIRIRLRDLLDSRNPRFNVLVDPGDVVKVTRAGIVYVVGEVKKPGGFLLKTNENISVLQAIALAEGLSRTAAAGRARIIRADKSSGRRLEIPIDLKKILAGKAPDPLLRSRDVVFVPNSTGKSAFYRGAEAALSIAGGVIVYRR